MIHLIPIDETLADLVTSDPAAFMEIYGLDFGENVDIIPSVVRQAMESTIDEPVMLDDIYGDFADVEISDLTPLSCSPPDTKRGKYLVADELLKSIVGTCGFKPGPSANSQIEIVFSTFPAYENCGYATAMAKELLTRTRRAVPAITAVAHTLPEENATTHILRKIGMRHVGDMDDDENGYLWRWEMPKLDPALF